MIALYTVMEGVIAFFLIAGSIFALIGSLGLTRMKDFYMRLHGPSKISTLGVGCILLASIAYGTKVDFEGVKLEGIERVSIADIRHANDMGFKVKLLGVAQMTGRDLEAQLHGPGQEGLYGRIAAAQMHRTARFDRRRVVDHPRAVEQAANGQRALEVPDIIAAQQALVLHLLCHRQRRGRPLFQRRVAVQAGQHAEHQHVHGGTHAHAGGPQRRGERLTVVVNLADGVRGAALHHVRARPRPERSHPLPLRR